MPADQSAEPESPSAASKSQMRYLIKEKILSRSFGLMAVLAAGMIVLGACGPSTEQPANGALAEGAELTEFWGCGVGFAASDKEQTVALFVYSNDHEPHPPVSFPDPAWEARLVVGTDLMANHCDDVIELDEPQQAIAEEWEISAGTLEFEDPQAGLCGAPGPVAGTFTGISAENADSTIEIGDLTIINDAFGCFAG